MKSNHTQGEWAYDINANKGFDIYLNGSIKTIANVLHRDISYMPSKQEAEANARLIAAAPDMYEALNDAKQLIENFQLCMGGNTALTALKTKGYSPYYDNVLAALSKAEGNI